MIDRERFFASAMARPFGGRMSADQIAGCNTILDEWEARPEFTDLRWLANILATTKWETAHTMQPIGEYGHGAGHSYGVPDARTGHAYYGRGYVQLTWKSNYQKMSVLTGVDLVSHPERALEPKVAAQILMEGMKGGMFTGKGLPTYFNATTDDPVNARRIVNGLDHAQDIAAIHRDFLAALGAKPAVQARPFLRRGSRGDAVKDLQRKLGITPDGIFGSGTEQAVKALQADQGLQVDGIVGPATWAALNVR